MFQIKKKLIYRHIAWLYALRSQLLVVKSWEHASQKGMIGKAAKKHKEEYGLNRVVDELTATELHHFLPDEEYDRMIAYKNTATQIIDQQAADLAALGEKNLVNDFTHVEFQKLLYDFYEHQGKAERIKNFPLPRQYATMRIIFIGIFIFLLPFGMVQQFAD